MTLNERSQLETELVTSALDNTLTETRYNEILDVLLPTVAGFPEAVAMLKGFGEPEWQKRRFERSKSASTLAA